MSKYFDTTIIPKSLSEEEVQNELDSCGVSRLSLEMACSDDDEEFFKSISLGVSLLNGGNSKVQESFRKSFEEKFSELFFAKLSQRIQDWIGELDHGGSSHRNPEKIKPKEGGSRKSKQENEISNEVFKYGQHVFRFLQLLCENHNYELQICLKKHGLVQQTLEYLEAVCGNITTTTSINSLLANQPKIDVINQAIISLTEYCQGPCHENQAAIATHDSHGIQICVSFILQDISSTKSHTLEALLQLKNNSAKFLLSTMESHQNHEVGERIVYNIESDQLVNFFFNFFFFFSFSF